MQLLRLGTVLLIGCLLICSVHAVDNRIRLINAWEGITISNIYCVDTNYSKTLFYQQSSDYMTVYYPLCTMEVRDANSNLLIPGMDLEPGGYQTLIFFNNSGFSYRIYNDSNDYGHLPIDTAVRVIAVGSLQEVRRLSLLGVSEECWNCAIAPLTNDLAQPFVQWVDTRWAIDLTINRSQPVGSAVIGYHYQEHAYYTLVVSFSNTDDPNIQVYKDRKGDDAFQPLWMLAIILVCVAAIWVLGWKLHTIATRRHTTDEYDSSASFSIQAGARAGANGKPKKERLRSLDTMRGICISVMIFVNYGGGNYWFFSHSLWNGLTFADLVFPWFIFMMGVAMALSLDSLRESMSTTALLYKVSRRSAILFALGLLVNGNYDFHSFRVMGVLQRFAVSYFVVSLVIMFVPKLKLTRTLEDEEELLRRDGDPSGSGEMRVRPRGILGGIYPYLIEWIAVLMLVALHTLLTFLLPVPGCPKGYLGPGGIANNNEYPECAGGAAGYIDRKILTSHHVYAGPTCSLFAQNYDSRVFGSGGLYDCPPYDPEGLLGCLTSIFLCYLGVQTGRFIRAYKYHAARLGRWLLLGLIFGGIGVGLAWGRQNGGWIPINKNLWSLSFVLVLGGSGMWLLSLLYSLIDVIDIWNGAPFIYVGMNSITIYVASEILSSDCSCAGVNGPRFPFGWAVNNPTHLNQLAQHVTAVAIFQLIAYYMYMCDFFLNV